MLFRSVGLPITAESPVEPPVTIEITDGSRLNTAHCETRFVDDRFLESPFAVDVVGRSGESHGNVTFHGRQMNNSALLACADAFVSNGGYSALSECLAFRENHARCFIECSAAAQFRYTSIGQMSPFWEQPRPAQVCLRFESADLVQDLTKNKRHLLRNHLKKN